MSPIRGMTDRGLAFPEIGRIRKGDRQGKNGAPRDLTYFRVEFDEKETEALTLFTQKYGPQPTEINVILPFNEIERCWDCWLEAYTAGRMVARSDGEKYIYLVDVATGSVLVKNGQPHRAYVEGEVLGTYKNRETGKTEEIKCKASGRLKVILPELGRAAFLTVLTGSIHDVVNLSDQLRAFAAVNHGRIAGIPFVLRRRPKKISIPRPDGSRARYEKWMLSIEADPDWVRKMLMETKRLALPGNGLALLPAPEPHEAEPADDPTGEPVSGEIMDDDWDPPSDAQPYDQDPPAVADTPAPASATADSAQQAKTSATPAGRPYVPDVLKTRISTFAARHAGKAATPNQVNLLAYTLKMCWPADPEADKKRHTVQRFLTGHESLKEMPGDFALALLDWLKPVKDSGGEYSPDPLAMKEAGLVLREALKQAGQQEIPF